MDFSLPPIKFKDTITALVNNLKKARLSLPVIVSLILFLFSLYDYLLFHFLAELFAVSIGMLLFAVAWAVYPYSRNHFLMYIACGYFWIAILDLFHALSYKGMSFFPIIDSIPSIQLWLSARYMESITLLIAPLFIIREIRRPLVFLSYMLAATIITLMVFYNLFPHVFEEGIGLTPFKIYSEYTIILILAASIGHLWYQREYLSSFVVYLMSVSIILTMISELAFTFYISIYDVSNLVGYIFKVFSFWLIFVAIIRTTLTKPYEQLKNEVTIRKKAEKALTSSNRALRVLRRTNEVMIGTTNENDLIEKVCKIIVETGGYRLAWIGYKYDDELKSLRCMSHAGIDAEFLKYPNLTWRRLENGGFPSGMAVRKKIGVLIQDIHSDTEYIPCRADAIKYDFSSLLALPLIIDDKVIGVLTIYAREKDAFSYEESDLLTDLANDVSYAIETLQARSENKQVKANLTATERKFKNLSEQSLVGVYITQGNEFKYVNPRLAEMFGYKNPSEVIGKVTPQQIVFQDDWNMVQENLRKRYENEIDALHYNFRFVSVDGQLHDAEVYGAATEYHDQPAVLGTFLDVTEQKHTEQLITASENRLRTMFEAEPECVKMIDINGNLTQMNPAGLALLEVNSFEDIKGKPLLEYIDAPYRDDFTQLFEDVFAGKSRKLEFEITGSKGARHFMETHAVPIIEDGEVTSLLAVSRDISKHKEAEQVLREDAIHTQQLLTQTVEAIALTVEKRDPYTAGHQTRVAELAILIGQEMGLDENRLTGLHLGAIIHDIGKIYIPAEILNRPGRLTDSEFGIVKSHPEVGYEIMKGVQFPWAVNEIIYQHHERIDGSGYPQGLKGDEITIEARIVAVADVIEAISSHRPYRPALGIDKAITEILRGRGTSYDPVVVDSFMALYEAGKIKITGLTT